MGAVLEFNFIWHPVMVGVYTEDEWPALTEPQGTRATVAVLPIIVGEGEF